MSFETVLQRFDGAPGVERGTNWRSPGLRRNGKIFVMLVDGEFVAKLPAARCEEIIAAGHARPFTSGKRTMREWVVVDEARSDEWVALAEEAYDFVA
jgi:hypothetical protein